MKTEGVLDRIVDGKYGTILAEEIGKEFVLNIEELPAHAKEGDWFDLVIENDQIQNLSINKKLTDERRRSIEGKMKMLQKRSGSKFKK